MTQYEAIPPYDFDREIESWERPPMGGRADFRSSEVKQWDMERIRRWIAESEKGQLSQPSHRDGQLLRSLLTGLSPEMRVLDFGCGFGWYALQYARRECKVDLADISSNNVGAARRVLEAHGFKAGRVYVTGERGADNLRLNHYDVILSTGVLHHTPHITLILASLAAGLKDRGEIRAMLYTDRLFRQKTGADPGDVRSDVTEHAGFRVYVRTWEKSGNYSDWYNEERLRLRVPAQLIVASFDYVGDGTVAVAVLKRTA